MGHSFLHDCPMVNSSRESLLLGIKGYKNPSSASNFFFLTTYHTTTELSIQEVLFLRIHVYIYSLLLSSSISINICIYTYQQYTEASNLSMSRSH